MAKIRCAGVGIVNAVNALGPLLGSVVTDAQSDEIPAARRCNPITNHNTRCFQQRFRRARGGRERLHALIHSEFPKVLDLRNSKDAA